MRLKTRVVMAFMFFALFATSAVGYFSYTRGKSNLTDQAYSFLHAVNSQKAEMFERWLVNASKDLKIIAEIAVFEDVFITKKSQSDRVNHLENNDLGTLVKKNLKPALSHGVFSELFLLSVPDGILIASTDENQVGKIVDQHQYFVQGQKHTYVESAFFSITLQRPTMVISTPIKDPATSQTLAVLVGRLDLHELSDSIKKQHSHWQTEDTYLVNNQNFFITDPLFGDDYTLRETIYTQGVTEALNGRGGTSRYTDYRGVNVLGDYLLMEQFNLIQVTEIDETEFFQPVAQIRRSILLIATAVFFCAILVGWGVAEIILKPLTFLVDRVKKVEAQDMTFRHDHDVPYEIYQLSSAFVSLLERFKSSLVSRDALQLEVEQRREAEEQLKMTLSKLQRSNEELEQFAYVASHDLQEPLRMVASYNQLLADTYKGKLDEKADKYIHYAVDGASRMQVLIQDLLSFSRVNTKEEEFTTVDTAEVLGETIANLSMLIQETGAVITNKEIPKVVGDKAQLIQLFQNLIANGIKFRRPDAPLLIHIKARKEDGKYLFSIQDNGIGIDPGHEERIFVIFKRLHTREEYPGTGIGLALCKRIVERHNGQIWYTSTVGQGTTFFFTLPSTEEDKPI